MRRVRIQSYKPSKSARALSEYLGIKRLRSKNSRFRGRASDVIVNWGNVKQVHNSQYLNPLEAVQTASNKLATFRALQAADVPIPTFDTNASFADDSDLVVARTDLYGHSGKGIVVGQPSELPYAPLYVQYIEKVAEYRAIVVNDQVVDFKQKKKRRPQSEENPDGHIGDHHPHVWNLGGGYIFARNDITPPPSAAPISIQALQAIGLKYGAVDLIEDSDGNVLVLEINTAWGLEGQTIQLVGDAIKEML